MKYIKEYGTTVAIILVGVVLAFQVFNTGTHSLEGLAAPDFQLTTTSGETVSLNKHLGKDVVVLDFWATWCPPCREGLPAVDALAKHFADKPVAVYGVNIMESPEQVTSFLTDNGLELPVVIDGTGIVAEDYGVTGIPQTVVIDTTGKVRNVHVGLSGNFEAMLRSEVDALLAEGAASGS